MSCLVVPNDVEELEAEPRSSRRPVARHSDYTTPRVVPDDFEIASLAIFSQLRQFGSNIELIAPASFISVAIPPCVFFALQRYFVQGLLAGSVK